MLRACNIHEHWGLNIRLESEVSLLFQSHCTAIGRKVLKLLSDFATRYKEMGKAVIEEIHRQWNSFRVIISADHLKKLWYDFGDRTFSYGNFDDDGNDLYIDSDPTPVMSELEQGLRGVNEEEENPMHEALDEEGEVWNEYKLAEEDRAEEDGDAL